MGRVCVIGGGAAGMMAAVFAAKSGAAVELYEKNEKLGKKLYITGKGRCNLTNDCGVEELLQHVCVNGKFLYSGFYGFTAQDAMAFFQEAGTPVKTERGGRVFPVSDHACDVTAALERKMRQYGVKIHLNTEVKGLLLEEGRTAGIRLSGREERFDRVIVATGGLSYPVTGSTGDGYRFAQEAGHEVTKCFPALVPMNVKEAWVKELQGLSLRNVRISIREMPDVGGDRQSIPGGGPEGKAKRQRGKGVLYEEFGEMLFTHFGVSGPLMLTASSYVGKLLRERPLGMSIDLKPALTRGQLDARVLRDFEASPNKSFKNVVSGLFPAKLLPVMVSLSGIQPEKKAHLITREERLGFVDRIRNLELTLTGLRDYREAVITRGGVAVQGVNPSTMESRLTPGLYFAGEVLDLDAVTGGYNLQIAWSTGYLAGTAAGKNIKRGVEKPREKEET